ncbi:DDE_3 domain-containing protein [Trichonephila clavipes]|nr:DDE_3 domain-containing protein [Trichonephila clavipes]
MHPRRNQATIRETRQECSLSVTDWRRVIFSDESRFSLSADDPPHTCLEAHRPAVDPAFIVERHTKAISQGVTVWGAISWDTRSSLVVLQHFDSSQIRGRYFNADCATHAIKSPGAIYQRDNARPHTAARLSQQCLQRYERPTMAACQVTRSFANRACLGRWEGNCSRRDTGELTAQMQRLWRDLPRS